MHYCINFRITVTFQGRTFKSFALRLRGRILSDCSSTYLLCSWGKGWICSTRTDGNLHEESLQWTWQVHLWWLFEICQRTLSSKLQLRPQQQQLKRQLKVCQGWNWNLFYCSKKPKTRDTVVNKRSLPFSQILCSYHSLWYVSNHCQNNLKRWFFFEIRALIDAFANTNFARSQEEQNLLESRKTKQEGKFANSHSGHNLSKKVRFLRPLDILPPTSSVIISERILSAFSWGPSKSSHFA